MFKKIVVREYTLLYFGGIISLVVVEGSNLFGKMTIPFNECGLEILQRGFLIGWIVGITRLGVWSVA